MPIADSEYLTAAVEAARRAGRMQLDRFNEAIVVEKKGAIDLVTEVDLAVERMLRALLAERFPDHAILAEELGQSEGAAHASHLWIVDPLDGTTNYAHGIPIFCVSIALRVDGVLHTGVVFDPSRDELFSAQRGAGAWLNGRRLTTSPAEQLTDAVLGTGFPYDVHHTLDEVVGLFRAFVGRARGVRRLGSAALDLSYVAAGRFDGFWEQRLMPWDLAAGALIVQEAGGMVTDWTGAPFDVFQPAIVASNGRLQQEMLEVLRQHLPPRQP